MEKSGLIVIPIALIVLGGIWYFTLGNKPATSSSTDAYSTTTGQVAQQGGVQAPAGQANASNGDTPVTNTNQQKIMQATLHTTKGDITIEFSDATPNTVANFIKLAQAGFYNGTKFHRVIKGFMIQGGDPLTKDDSMMARWGTGGPGYQFADEIGASNQNNIGTIAMANSGPNTNGSQFFINVAGNNFLDTKHTVFGKVVAGMDVVTAIENTPTVPGDRPQTAMVITSVDLK
jgi:peptidylprolyl isomerase